VIDQIVEAARSVAGAHVLDLHSDADHNRSVLTLLGEAEPLTEAVYRCICKATGLIDMRTHTGEHPRIGATDVVPFIPIGESSMADAIASARHLAQRVSEELHIPVYFYEEAATRPERQNLENVRKKGFEELCEVIGQDESRRPDLGVPKIHETAGAIIIGARGPLIAYNIYLNTNDLQVAKAIAKQVRHSSGGLRYVKGLGLDIPARKQVQISMNLTNFRKSAIHTVFEMVSSIARSYGVSITDSEIVGLVPMEALMEAARFYLRLHDFDTDQILETKLLDS